MSETDRVVMHATVTSRRDLFLALALLLICFGGAAGFVAMVQYGDAADVAMAAAEKADAKSSADPVAQAAKPVEAVSPPAAKVEPATRSGLRTALYRWPSPLTDFPQLAADRSPDLERVDATLNYGDTPNGVMGTDWKEHVFVRWTGKLRVPADGRYRLHLISNDGSRLYLNDQVAVDHGGPHGMVEKTGDVDLKAGVVPIRLDYFQSGGTSGCVLAWTRPDGVREVVPESAFFHHEEPAVVSQR